jgi:hypothetical protein
MKKYVYAAVLAISSMVSAHADTITGLVNTGTGASGTADTNYVLNGNTTGYVTQNNVWPIGPWLANSATSKWITPTQNQAQSFDATANGTYIWTLSFDLSGYNPATASFSGRFAADNSATVSLNGTQIGTSAGFGSFSSFAASSGFVSGLNTLSFVVTNLKQNGGNPTGLRAEFLASSVTAVPEPETYAMLLAGLALMGAVARRRKQA